MNGLDRVGKAGVLLALLITIPAVLGVLSDRRRGAAEAVPDGYDLTLNELLKDEKFKGLLQNPDLIKTIEKRLGAARRGDSDDGGERGLERRREDIRDEDRGSLGGMFDDSENSGRCPAAKSKSGFIIKTKDSLQNGAVFIESPGTLRDPDDCVQRCCANKNCNTAIIKTAKEGSLACYLFDCGQPNICLFSSNTDFTVVQFPSRGSPHKQEQDLVELVETTPLVPSTTIAAPTAVSLPRGQLLGRCGDEGVCGVDHSVCLEGRCKCAEGFHVFNDRCKPDCREYEFECSHIDQACIAIYDRCDGTEQCMDKTDEIDCPSHYDGTSGSAKNKSSSSLSEDEKKSHNKDQVSPSHDSKDVSTDTKKVVPPKDTSDRSTFSTTTESSPAEKRVSDDSHSHERNVETESVELSHWSMPANHGAVVALVLGMLVTTMLIILVGCRLRNVRRRSRKGQPMGGNDADYLINGMYL